MWHGFGTDRADVILDLLVNIRRPSTNPDTVHLLAHVLAAAGEDGATELVPLLDHQDRIVRRCASAGLGWLGPQARWAVPTLGRRLTEDPSEYAKNFWLAVALGLIGGREAIRVLERGLARAQTLPPFDEDYISLLERCLDAAHAEP